MAGLRNIASASDVSRRILPPKYSKFGHYHTLGKVDDGNFSCGCGTRFTNLADALEHLEDTCVFASVNDLLQRDTLEEQVAYINEHPNL